MSDYTTAEITAFVEADDDFSWSEAFYGEYETITLRGESVPVKTILAEGGEGQGDYAAFVFQVGDQLFRKEGFYASHYGFEFDGDFDEVRPAEKTVTVYEPVKS